MSAEITLNAATEVDNPEEKAYMEQAQKWLSGLVLVPVLTMEEFEASLPKPPAAPIRKRIWRQFRRMRNAYYAKKLDGLTGALANGVVWLLKALPPEQAIEWCTGYMTITFDDPRCCGIHAGAYDHFFDGFDPEVEYADQLKEHARKMGLRQLVPAEPGDPDGFFVMWESAAKRRQKE